MSALFIGKKKYKIMNGNTCYTPTIVFDPDILPYDIGTPSFVLPMEKGSTNYYSDGTITAELSEVSPTFESNGQGPWYSVNKFQGSKGFLAQTAPSSPRRYINLKMTAEVQSSPWVIEFWLKLDNNGTDSSIYQTFLGNMMKNDDGTYDGWSYRWAQAASSYGALDLVVGKGTTSLSHTYNGLKNTNTLEHFVNNTISGSWAHYGIYYDGTHVYLLNNGYCYYIQSSLSLLTSPLDNIYVANAKYGTGYTLSSMSNLRILLNNNATNYMNAIDALDLGNDGTDYVAKYQIPTGPFSNSGLEQFTATYIGE